MFIFSMLQSLKKIEIRFCTGYLHHIVFEIRGVYVGRSYLNIGVDDMDK